MRWQRYGEEYRSSTNVGAISAMEREDFKQLVDDIRLELANDATATFAILGHTSLAYDICGFFHSVGMEKRVIGIYGHVTPREFLKPWIELARDKPTVAVVASDESKEEILEQAAPHLGPATKILLAGYAHFRFRDR